MLFVCTENICRSPLAEGLMRYHLEEAGLGRRVKVSSAGTRASQPGARPDKRASNVAAYAGINLGRIRASKVTPRELQRNDIILAMDQSNLRDLLHLSPSENEYKISLLLSHEPGQIMSEVPDPYYGSYEGFEQVFQILDAAVRALMAEIFSQDY